MENTASFFCLRDWRCEPELNMSMVWKFSATVISALSTEGNINNTWLRPEIEMKAHHMKSDSCPYLIL